MPSPRASVFVLIGIFAFIFFLTSTQTTGTRRNDLTDLKTNLVHNIEYENLQESVSSVQHSEVDSSVTHAEPKAASYVKPANVTIIGLVFYGRKDRVEVLRCYLERNMANNGGWLDEIHWYENTDKEQDLAYLDQIMASNPRYKKIKKISGGIDPYRDVWGRMQRGALYVKIDDDVMFFEDHAIPSIVTRKLAHPEYLLVSANLINNPLLGWLHYRTGAVHPYLPEYRTPDNETTSPPSRSWRYTDHPVWEGPDDFRAGWDYVVPTDNDGASLPANAGPRWLRLSNNDAMNRTYAMNRTPMKDTEYGVFGTGWRSWAIAAQHHYSLLENIADQRLDRYKLGKEWIVNYDRISINFMTIWADEVLDNLPMDDGDEPWLTQLLPQRLAKSVVVDTDVLASHFSFGLQDGGMKATDLVARYKSYADENVCLT